MRDPEEHRKAISELKKLVARPARPRYPDPRAIVRRRFEGLRLLTPGDHPEIVRLYRMVAAHVRNRLAERASATLGRLRNSVENSALTLQDAWLHDPATLWELAPLQEAVRHWRHGDQDIALGRIAGDILPSFQRARAAREQQLAATLPHFPKCGTLPSGAGRPMSLEHSAIAASRRSVASS